MRSGRDILEAAESWEVAERAELVSFLRSRHLGRPSSQYCHYVYR